MTESFKSMSTVLQLYSCCSIRDTSANCSVDEILIRDRVWRSALAHANGAGTPADIKHKLTTF